MSMTRWFLLVVGAVATSLVAACGDEPAAPPTCTPVPVDTNCTESYAPTFDMIFANTLKPTCGRSGASCHSSRGRQGGLALEEIEEAYKTFVAEGAAVRPGDPSCSPVVARLVSEDPFLRMPPGKTLPPGEMCAIVKWIAGGAKR